MKFELIKQQAEQFLSRNGATVLTAGGVIGTVTTAVLAARASFKASELLHEAEANYALESDGLGRLDTTDKVKIVWPQYIPAVAVGGISVGCIIGANMVSARKMAAIAAMYAIQDERFNAYKAKVAEHLTGPKQQKVIDELAQDSVDKEPPNPKLIVAKPDGNVLCKDLLSGRYFFSTVEKIKRAELDIKEEIYNHNSCSLAEFYIKVGLEPTPYSQEVGWSLDNPIEISFSTTRTPDEEPCITVDFGVLPKAEYHRSSYS